MNKSNPDTINLIHSLDNLLKQGQIAEVQSQLKKLSGPKIPRRHLAELASLARRAHQWKLSLRWLYPIVRPKIKNSSSATPTEIIEYAMALQKAGAMNEAETLLNQIDLTTQPKALLSLAYICMARWDYEGAEALLSRYLQSSAISDYERLIAQVNIAASFVFLKKREATSYLQSLEKDLVQAKANLLLANCFEISAQYHVGNKEWTLATASLTKAQQLVDLQKNLDSLFIKKWKVVNEALRTQNENLLTEFRAEALAASHWETLRDLDFYQALINPLGFWTDWVYYGTPHAHFRKRLESIKDFPPEKLIHRSSRAEITIDPWFPKQNQGDLSHRCYVLLLEDLYRPLRVGPLFEALFPDEYYNPQSSPNRIYQTMTRFSQWLIDLELPFTLVEMDGAYSLRIPENVKVVARTQRLNLGESHFYFERYRSTLPAEFTAEELAEAIGQPKEKLQRQIKAAVEKQCLIKSGQGRYTIYSFNYLTKEF